MPEKSGGVEAQVPSTEKEREMKTGTGFTGKPFNRDTEGATKTRTEVGLKAEA